MSEPTWNDRYAQGNTPWDSGTPSAELIRVLDAGTITGHTILEIGCGTGTNAVLLARRGFEVTAIDLVERAVHAAREKARAAGVTVDFRVADFLYDNVGGPYDILVDRGVYHVLRQVDLKAFEDAVGRVTRSGGWWLSLAGNSREPHDPGPPTVSEADIRAELGPHFDIVELREFRFDAGQDGFRPLGWSILMRRR